MKTSVEVPDAVFDKYDWYDKDGFVFRGFTVEEAEPGWVILDESQQQHVQMLTKFDKKRYDANQARKTTLGKRVDCGIDKTKLKSKR